MDKDTQSNNQVFSSTSVEQWRVFIHIQLVTRACGSRVLLVFRRREGGVEGGVRSVGAGASGRRVGLLSV